MVFHCLLSSVSRPFPFLIWACHRHISVMLRAWCVHTTGTLQVHYRHSANEFQALLVAFRVFIDGHGEWKLQENCKKIAWLLHSSYMALAWLLHGSCMVYACIFRLIMSSLFNLLCLSFCINFADHFLSHFPIIFQSFCEHFAQQCKTKKTKQSTKQLQPPCT